MSRSTDLRLLGAVILLLSLGWSLDLPHSRVTDFLIGGALALGLLVTVTGRPVLKALVDRANGQSGTASLSPHRD